jgi:hypothetical protein
MGFEAEKEADCCEEAGGRAGLRLLKCGIKAISGKATQLHFMKHGFPDGPHKLFFNKFALALHFIGKAD